jgi:pimeloyl-ACP methyl ester carboxylesterase
VDDVRVSDSIKIAGEGDPVVFLHGGPGLRDYGVLLQSELAEWRLIHYQQRGLAPSPTTGPFTVEQHFEDLISVLDAQGMDRVVLLGHSWGCSLGLYTAIVAPERVAGLVLVDPLGTDGDGGASAMNHTLTERLLPAVRPQAKEVDKRLSLPQPTDEDGTEYLALRWPGYFASPENAPPLPSDFAFSLTCNVQTMTSLLEHMAGGTFTRALSALHMPVEFVIGKESPIPTEASQSTAAMLPHANTTIVPNAGHLPWYERPGCVREALERLSIKCAL